MRIWSCMSTEMMSAFALCLFLCICLGLVLILAHFPQPMYLNSTSLNFQTFHLHSMCSPQEALDYMSVALDLVRYCPALGHEAGRMAEELARCCQPGAAAGVP